MRRFRLTVGKAHRKVTPAAQPRVENLNVAGAVHRLHGHFHVASQRVDAFSVRGCTRSCQNASILSRHSFCTLLNMFSLYLSAWPDLIHKVLFTIGMQASQLFGSAMDKRVCPLLSPCIAVRRNHFLVAATVNLSADVVLQGVHHLGALRVPEHHARRMVFDVVEVHLTPSASAAAPRSCRKASFSSRHSACTLFLTVHAAVASRDKGVPHTIVWVGLYCKATRAHLRHARAALATKSRFASLVPKGSLSLTQMLKKIHLSYKFYVYFK